MPEKIFPTPQGPVHQNGAVCLDPGSATQNLESCAIKGSFSHVIDFVHGRLGFAQPGGPQTTLQTLCITD